MPDSHVSSCRRMNLKGFSIGWPQREVEIDLT